MTRFGTSISRGLISGFIVFTVFIVFIVTMLWLPGRASYAAEPGVPAEQVAGKAIYDARCASCHGPGGRGTPDQIPAIGPPLNGNPFVTYGAAEALQKIIRTGRTGWKGRYDEYPNMPSFDATMIADLRPLIAYLKGQMQQDSTSPSVSPQSSVDSE